MGERILDFIVDRSLTVCNNGESTRVNRGTGGTSTPDITLASAALSNKVEWTTATVEDLGSNHLPIIMEIKHDQVRTHQTDRKRKRWRQNKIEWPAFTDQVEEERAAQRKTRQEKTPKFKDWTRSFTDTMIKAGNIHVGKVTPRTREEWVSPAVKTAIKKRNQLRRNIGEKRAEWIAACREVTELIREAKEAAWVEFVEDLQHDTDPAEIWRTIKSLSGTPASQAPNEAIISHGKAITTNAEKANLFAKHYAKVSKLEFSKDERDRIREMKRAFEPEDTTVKEEDKECCKPFSIEELKTAIKSMRTKGAPGVDDIPPAFIKNLGPVALEELLEIANHSFLTGEVPKSWRHAIIIPLLKAGKPASQIASFRPISLTSCLMKTVERLVVNRLYYLAETRGWLTSAQAGFRKQRSCEDQILRLTQGVSDGLQRGKRTLMVLIDYSKAYDRVWQEELMMGMIEKGVPMLFMRWIRSFLAVRTAQVMYNGALSRTVFLRQGLPQGSVISPLLFLFYIDDLATVIPEEVLIAMFADDAAIWVYDSCLKRASKKIQAALKAIEEWSRRRKMEINTSKSEATFFDFSNDPKEARWRPELTLNSTPVPFNASPRFLGVHLDRTLSFMDHTVYVADEVSKRCRILASLASKTWGWRKESLRPVYLAVQRSINYNGLCCPCLAAVPVYHQI